MTQNPSKDINKTIDIQKDMSQQNYLSPFEDDTIDLFELFLTIWNWKWLILIIFILGTLGSYGVTSICLLYTSPSPRDMRRSRMPSSA